MGFCLGHQVSYLSLILATWVWSSVMKVYRFPMPQPGVTTWILQGDGGTGTEYEGARLISRSLQGASSTITKVHPEHYGTTADPAQSRGQEVEFIGETY